VVLDYKISNVKRSSLGNERKAEETARMEKHKGREKRKERNKKK
jgi:hypothetical protein